MGQGKNGNTHNCECKTPTVSTPKQIATIKEENAKTFAVYPAISIEETEISSDTTSFDIGSLVEEKADEVGAVTIGPMTLDYPSEQEPEGEDEVAKKHAEHCSSGGVCKKQAEEKRDWERKEAEQIKSSQGKIFRTLLMVSRRLGLPFILKVRGRRAHQDAVRFLLEVSIVTHLPERHHHSIKYK